MNGSGTTAARQARVVYGALFGSLVIGTAMLAFLRLRGGVAPGLTDATAGLLRWVAIGVTLIGVVAVRALRARAPAPGSATDRDVWWQGDGRWVFVSWALAEGIGMVGPILFMLNGDTVTLAVPVLWAVVTLLVLSPGRVEGG